MTNKYKKFLVLSNAGGDGWYIVEETDTFDDAVKIREKSLLSYGREIIIVEYCPLVVFDGRLALKKCLKTK